MFEQALRDRRRACHHAALALLVAAVTACGGGEGGGDSTPPDAAPPPAQANIGSAGGTLNGPGEVRLDVPADALAANTVLSIAQSAAGAPPLPALPAGMAVVGPMRTLTPHGTEFGIPATLSMPLGAALPAGAVPVLLKTNAANDGWEQIDAEVLGDRLVAPITGFSSVISMSMCNSPECVPIGPPTIGTPPRGGSVDEEGYVLLSVAALGAGPFSYQWRGLNTGRDLSQERGASIVLNPVSLSDDGLSLVVTVTDARGNSVNSVPAQIRVRPIAPRVVSQPLDLQAVVGSPAEFSAGTRSSIAQSLQWARSNDAGASWNDAPAPSQATRLRMASVGMADNGARFRLRATNASGNVLTREARLTVLPLPAPPQVTAPPVDLAAVPGRGAEFSAQAIGGDLVYQWQRSADGLTWQPVASGGDGPLMTLSNVTPADNDARFRVVVSNAAGSATSAPGRLTVTPSISQGLTRVGGGLGHSLALAADGRLYSWGDNRRGQGGQGSSAATLGPALVPGLNNIASFAAGGSHNLALHSDGSVSVWGDNTLGQLDLGNIASSDVPLAMPRNPMLGRFVVAGTQHSGLLDAAAGSAGTPRSWVWGSGLIGIGGRYGYTDPLRGYVWPARHGHLPDASLVRGAFGPNHSLAIRRDGTVFAWGFNHYGQLGLGTYAARGTAAWAASLARIVAVAVGEDHSMALNEDGQVHVWGSNAAGQLGLGSLMRNSNLPQRVTLPGPALAIASGARHLLVLLWDGRVMAWGGNLSGQVGNGGNLDVRAPVEVTAPWTAPVQAIGAGAEHSLVLDAAGRVWAWGANAQSQLGDGTQQPRNRPVQVQGVNLLGI